MRDEIRQVQEVARSSLEEVRQVARRLRPGELEELGLVSALSALVSEMATHTGARVRRRLGTGLPALEPDVELVLYRIAQEGLTNAARHAQADVLELSLDREGDSLVLRVADNGRGLGSHEEGTGLRGMRERALLIGARLRVGSRPRGGTEVCLALPLPATEPVPGPASTPTSDHA